MEPISTLIAAALLFSPAVSTRRLAWEGTSRNEYVASNVEKHTWTPLLSDAVIPPTDRILYKPSVMPTLSAREQLKRETKTYSAIKPGWDGPDSVGPSAEAMTKMLTLIDAVPARLPLPRPMLSRNGELGLYWDLDGGYAELSIEVDGHISFFSRNMMGAEYFDEGLAVEIFNQNWFWGAIGHLDAPLLVAA